MYCHYDLVYVVVGMFLYFNKVTSCRFSSVFWGAVVEVVPKNWDQLISTLNYSTSLTLTDIQDNSNPASSFSLSLEPFICSSATQVTKKKNLNKVAFKRPTGCLTCVAVYIEKLEDEVSKHSAFTQQLTPITSL